MGTQNFYDATLYNMEKHIEERVALTGKRLPYHLQYAKMNGKITEEQRLPNQKKSNKD